ncbi:disks large-associated protein 5 [Asbolus verrucosus]|uniref:Disks large-associated protein 5 n=1 Tax=Asbolus verrucosus TaxID=1661398 RepID=A0A482WE06_ASBVE|nr:disks large-associated protein 5 [Asbolus verrucosus]
MEDLSVILKKHFEDLYKKNGAVGTVKGRVEKMNEQRKIIRHDVAFEKRKIPANMSPVASPVIKRDRAPQNADKPVNKRLEMLIKWKADKEKKKQERKKNLKPLFKVTHVPVNVGLPNLETVNKEIKGKLIRSKFAPPNHKFKPPANIKPINILQEEKKEIRQMVTRSQTRNITGSSNAGMLPKETRKKSLPKNKKQPKQKDKDNEKISTKRNVDKGMSPDFPINTNLSSEVKTPDKGEPPVYVSPFVTISRGKNSARKEYEARRSGKSFSSKSDALNCTSPTAGAAYFSWRLDNQIARLQELCEQWNRYKIEESPPEEAVSMIDVTIGQTNLLITKKFVQFRGLIDKCKSEDTETPVTCEDLHGFWDMIHIQVENLDKRFENLDSLKANNWQEIIPEVNRKTMKKKGRPLKAAKASAGLKEAIQAARRKKLGEMTELEVYAEKKTPQNRRTIHLLGTKSVENTHRNSSPGLMMMKVAQFAKGVEPRRQQGGLHD